MNTLTELSFWFAGIGATGIGCALIVVGVLFILRAIEVLP